MNVMYINKTKSMKKMNYSMIRDGDFDMFINFFYDPKIKKSLKETCGLLYYGINELR